MRIILDSESDIIPFGKYKGKTIGEVVKLKDFGYLLWLQHTLFDNFLKKKYNRPYDIDRKLVSDWKNRFYEQNNYTDFDYNLYCGNKIEKNSRKYKPNSANGLAMQEYDYGECNDYWPEY